MHIHTYVRTCMRDGHWAAQPHHALLAPRSRDSLLFALLCAAAMRERERETFLCVSVVWARVLRDEE